MLIDKDVQATDLTGIYSEMAEIIKIEDVVALYQHFKGQQVSFPTRLYSKEYVLKQVNNSDKEPIKKLATKYGYSERRLRQIINENSEG